MMQYSQNLCLTGTPILISWILLDGLLIGGTLLLLQLVGELFANALQRKQAETRLREQQTRLNLALEAANMGIWEANLLTGEEILSPQAEALLGFAPGTFDGRRESFLHRVHPDDLDSVQQSDRVALQTGRLQDEFRVVLPDQTIRWIYCLGKVFYDEAGTPTRIVGVDLDITERKYAEEALRQSETRFRQLAENIQEVFWIADVEFTQILYVSPAYETIWGRTCASLYENPASFADAIHPEDYDRALAVIQQQRHQGWDQEYRIIQPNGTLRWIWEQAFPVADHSGQIDRIVGICQDITDRKAAEAALAESQKQYQNLVENSPDIIERFDLALRHQYVSPSLTDLTGIPEAEFLGKTCRDLGMDENMVSTWEAAAMR
ncbi:MAG: PAS domain-containing protein, partial [Leptodesmis sp.]|uniref:PAS domain-containing protein n=1 Tax=Leptodesmis sp. TaxID=3100501 RepID=UPI003D0EBEE7